MKIKPTKQWIINQVVIVLFGVFVAINGYHAYMNRLFIDSHFRISIDLGENHYIYGLVIMALGILVSLIGIYTTIYFFVKKHDN